jgi:hypothetical protein
MAPGRETAVILSSGGSRKSVGVLLSLFIKLYLFLKSYGDSTKWIVFGRCWRHTKVAVQIKLDVFGHQIFQAGVNRPHPA